MKTLFRSSMLFGWMGAVVLIMAVHPCMLRAQVTVQELSKAIPVDNLQHPYLYFTEQEKPAIIKRIQTDPEAKSIMAGLLMEGHRLLYVPVQDPPPARVKHPRYGTVGDPLNSYAGEISEGAVKLAFLYQMTGEAKYAKKAIEFAVAICNLNSWAQAAHRFDIIYPRVWPWNVPDDRVVFSYDITSADRAIAVSTVYDWVYPVLSKWERDKLRNGLLEQAITKVRGNYDLFWWSSAHRCNWSAICYTGLGMTAFTLLKENPQLVDVIAETYNKMGLTFDQIGDDGGWQEGRGYYGYMLRVSVQFMDVVKRLTGGKYNLFKHNKIYGHPFDFFLYGLTADFEDGQGSPIGPTHIINKVTTETGNATAAWYRSNFLGQGTTMFDILWPRPEVKPTEPEQKSKLFKSINWAMLRSDFIDPSGVTIACKAGYNDDPHHGHLDCGQFMLTWNGVPFIRDVGRMRYDEQYFNEDRWLYPYASSEGHNLIFVNGERQIPAKLKDQPWKKGIGGEILDFRTSAARDYVLMDPTHAYPGNELKKWRRNIVLQKPATTLILDEVGANPGSTVAARFFPAAAQNPEPRDRTGRGRMTPGVEYKIADNYVLMTSQRNRMALIPIVLDNTCRIIEGKLPAMPVTEDAVLAWMPYIETVSKAKSNTSVVLTIILPVYDEKEAASFSASAKAVQVNAGQIEVSIGTASGSLKWIFEKGKDGYILKD